MGLFSKKSKPDPAYQASQQASQSVMDQMANMQLPALPVIPQAATPKVNVPASLPSYLGGGANTVYPAGLPNQLSMIANQLSAGGYGAPQAIQSQLSGIYHPQTVAPKPPPAPVAPVKPAVVAAKTPVVAAAPAAASAPAAAPVAARRPMGFTAQQQMPELNTTGHSLNQGPMFALPSDLIKFLTQSPARPSNIYGNVSYTSRR